jgi:hypothetical protein
MKLPARHVAALGDFVANNAKLSVPWRFIPLEGFAHESVRHDRVPRNQISFSMVVTIRIPLVLSE